MASDEFHAWHAWHDALKELRAKQHWRQEDLAKEVGVSKQAVQQWEAGRSTPTGDRAERLKELLTRYFTQEEQNRLWSAAHVGNVGDRREPVYFGRFSGRVPEFGEMVETLRMALPDHLKPYAGGSIKAMRMSIPFLYASPKVIAHAIWGAPNGARLEKVRSSAWRMLVARHSTNDIYPTSKHYFMGVLELPGGNGTNKYHSILDTEFAAVDIKLQRITSLDELSRIIPVLEGAPTEAEMDYEQMQQEDFSDLV